jgi:glycosyltransferase involved in cell wall biosynthesis
MRERISIALATFNGEKYLEEQLRSFLQQTCQPDELIICDDCSSDATVDIARAFAETVQFEVKIVVNSATLGFSQNFSRALQYCTGDVVLLCDQDDVWLPEKIEKMLCRLAAEPEAQLLIHDLAYCKEDLTQIGQTKIERMQEVSDLNRYYVVGMATVIRGPFLKLCLPIPDEFAHDTWLHACARAIDVKRIVSDVLAMYRRHASNTTKTGNLNVDFVTTPAYFRRSKRAYFELIKNKTVLSDVNTKLLLGWLQANRSVLIEREYISAACIDRVIENEERRMASVAERAEILAMGRLKRFKGVFSFFRRGGYQYDNGWKSAIKDLLCN